MNFTHSRLPMAYALNDADLVALRRRFPPDHPWHGQETGAATSGINMLRQLESWNPYLRQAPNCGDRFHAPQTWLLRAASLISGVQPEHLAFQVDPELLRQALADAGDTGAAEPMMELDVDEAMELLVRSAPFAHAQMLALARSSWANTYAAAHKRHETDLLKYGLNMANWMADKNKAEARAHKENNVECARLANAHVAECERIQREYARGDADLFDAGPDLPDAPSFPEYVPPYLSPKPTEPEKTPTLLQGPELSADTVQDLDKWRAFMEGATYYDVWRFRQDVLDAVACEVDIQAENLIVGEAVDMALLFENAAQSIGRAWRPVVQAWLDAAPLTPLPPARLAVTGPA